MSNRPGLKSASSILSILFVAASTMTPSLDEKPSISTSNWFNVWSYSLSAPVSPAPRLPKLSNSSIKIIHGAVFLARWNNALILLAPTPTYLSTNEEPAISIIGTPASPAMALADKVLPTPGGPAINTPLGRRAPTAKYRSLFFRKSTISKSSSLASSIPATSAKVIFGFDSDMPELFDPPTATEAELHGQWPTFL